MSNGCGMIECYEPSRISYCTGGSSSYNKPYDDDNNASNVILYDSDLDYYNEF